MRNEAGVAISAICVEISRFSNNFPQQEGVFKISSSVPLGQEYRDSWLDEPKSETPTMEFIYFNAWSHRNDTGWSEYHWNNKTLNFDSKREEPVIRPGSPSLPGSFFSQVNHCRRQELLSGYPRIVTKQVSPRTAIPVRCRPNSNISFDRNNYAWQHLRQRSTSDQYVQVWMNFEGVPVWELLINEWNRNLINS